MQGFSGGLCKFCAHLQHFAHLAKKQGSLSSLCSVGFGMRLTVLFFDALAALGIIAV